MTNSYRILYKGRIIGLFYISPHPKLDRNKITSIAPLTRKGKFEDDNLEFTLENPITDIFPDSIADIEVARDLCGQAGIEGWKVEITPY
jgi:hypothetical protein